jgi:hypothetical protein
MALSIRSYGCCGHNSADNALLLWCRTTPFAAKNYLSTYKKIAAYSKHGKLKWHTELSPSVQTLIQGMLHPKPQHRLGNTTGGIDELKGHEWFRPVDWDLLLQKKVRRVWLTERAGHSAGWGVTGRSPLSLSCLRSLRHRSYPRSRIRRT